MSSLNDSRLIIALITASIALTGGFMIFTTEQLIDHILEPSHSAAKIQIENIGKTVNKNSDKIDIVLEKLSAIQKKELMSTDFQP